MAEDIDLGEDDGMIAVVVGESRLTFDLYALAARITDFHREHSGKPDAEYGALLLEFVQELGIPAQSTRMAMRFTEMVRDRYTALKKNGKPTAASSASITDSILEPYPHPSATA